MAVAAGWGLYDYATSHYTGAKGKKGLMAGGPLAASLSIPLMSKSRMYHPMSSGIVGTAPLGTGLTAGSHGPGIHVDMRGSTFHGVDETAVTKVIHRAVRNGLTRATQGSGTYIPSPLATGSGAGG